MIDLGSLMLALLTATLYGLHKEDYSAGCFMFLLLTYAYQLARLIA